MKVIPRPNLTAIVTIGSLLIVLATAAEPPGKLIRSDEPCIGVPAITSHEIAMVVRANRYRLQECYLKALKEKPGLKGKFTACFLLTDAGSQVRISESTLGYQPFESCAREALEKFRFPPLRYKIGQQVKVNYPFVFSPENPFNRPPDFEIHYREDQVPAVKQDESSLTVTLPRDGRTRLTSANPDYRLILNQDFANRDPSVNNLPRPLAAVSNFDRSGEDDLAIALRHKWAPGRWRLVVLHHHPEGYRPVKVADFEDIESHFKDKSGRRPAFFVTKEARCFCERRCLSIASNLGKAYEFEWDGKKYKGKLIDYLAPAGQ